MTEPKILLPDNARPELLRGVRTRWEEVRGSWVLLAPERAIMLDDIAMAILNEADGKTSFTQIVERLADKYAAPAEQIANDAHAFLVSLIERRMAEAH